MCSCIFCLGLRCLESGELNLGLDSYSVRVLCCFTISISAPQIPFSQVNLPLIFNVFLFDYKVKSFLLSQGRLDRGLAAIGNGTTTTRVGDTRLRAG
ncbi:hypothetical protein LguiB_005923 [Lonicera macranthoides]